jgi:subfamily B ATP-binding cassette protein HlyB/CyaB
VAHFNHEKISRSLIKTKELEDVRAFLTEKMMPACFDQLCVIFLIVTMLFYDLVLTGIVLLALCLCFVVTLLFTPVLKRRLTNISSKEMEGQFTLAQTVFNIETVNALSIKFRVRQHWEKQIVDILRTKLRLVQETNFLSLFCTTILKVAWVVVLWLAGEKVIANELSIGAFVAFTILLSQVFFQSSQFISVWFRSVQFIQSLGAIDETNKDATQNTKSRFALPKIKGLIQFDDVTFRYRPQGVDILKNMQLTILPGEILGIIGQSSVGKSTVSNLLRRQCEPIKGRVLIDGHDIQTVDLLTLNSQVGVIGVNEQLLNGTIRDNITLTNPKLTTEQVVNVAILAGAHPFICNLPEGYDTQIHRGGINLSTGERCLIALARVLAANTEILILDGFLDNLGPVQEGYIQSVLSDLVPNRTVLILTQRPSTLKNVTRVAVLEKGQIVESDTPAALLNKKNSVFKKMVIAEQKYAMSVDASSECNDPRAECSP